VPATRHANGKGWVAATAVVENSVYIGPRAQVFNNAYVSGNVRLEGRTKIFGNATVSGDVTLKKTASIGGRAVVRDRVLMSDNAVISGAAKVTGNTNLYGDSRIGDSAQVDSCTLSESVQIFGNTLVMRSHLSGTSLVSANSIVINAQVNGKVVIRGSAQILGGCTVRSWHPTLETIVEGNAVMADEAHIWYPIHVKGHAVLIRCRLSHGYGHIDSQPEISGNVVLQARNFGSRAELDQFLTAISNMTIQQGGVAANFASGSIPTVPGFPVRQVNFLADNSRPRRVQRLQEAGV